MSTARKIVAYEKSGRLKRFAPRLVGHEREFRILTTTPEISEWLYDEGKRGELAELKAASRSLFAVFVKGELIDNCDFMKRVEDRRSLHDPFSHGVWAIRGLSEPQYRFFGAFPLQDWFLTLSMVDRASLEASPNTWHRQIDECLRLWSVLFPSAFPTTGNNLCAYIRDNVEACDDRWQGA